MRTKRGVEKPQVGPGESSNAAGRGVDGGLIKTRWAVRTADRGWGTPLSQAPGTRGGRVGKGAREEISHAAELPLVSKQVQALR